MKSFITDSDFDCVDVFALLSITALCLVVIAISYAFWYDGQELTASKVEQLHLSDKWHEDSCFPLYDANNNYTGESCSDRWMLIFSDSSSRLEKSVTGTEFKEYKVGDRFQRSYKIGKLGFLHDEDFEKLGGRS